MEQCTPALLTTLLPFLTGVVGAVLAFAFGVWRDKRQVSDARSDERRRAQREEIGKLQFASDELANVVYRSLVFDNNPMLAAAMGFVLGDGDSWTKRFEETDRAFRIHATNIEDPELQTRIARFRDVVYEARNRKLDPQELEQAGNEIQRANLDILEYAGTRNQALM